MNYSRDIFYRDEAQLKIARGAEKVYNVAAAAYGPKAGNVLIEMSYGNPVLSRDGVTNVQRVRLEDPVEDMAAQIIVQASKKNNEKVGDGTTAAVILAYHLLKSAQRRALHINPMAVVRELEEAGRVATSYIESLQTEVNDNLLASIARISAGDEAIGEMIAELIHQVGADGGVSVYDFDGVGIVDEVVDGFYFAKGFTDVRLINNYSLLKAEYHNVAILIADKRLSTTADIAPIIDKVVGDGIKELVIIGEVADDALAFLMLNKVHGIITATVAEPPVVAGNKALFLEDIAVLTGGKVVTEGFNASDFDPKEYLGAAEKVVINEFSTTILGADGDHADLEQRISDLKSQLEEATNPGTSQAIKDRLSKLTGKIAIIRVGGATETEQKELKLRVEDAVCAVQAAMKDGIVPGGGVALARVTGTAFDEAFKEPFKQLVHNAGRNAELYLAKIEESDNAWLGYDLKSDAAQLVDLIEAGVVDPALVMKEVVANAVSVAKGLITVGSTITFTERPSEQRAA